MGLPFIYIDQIAISMEQLLTHRFPSVGATKVSNIFKFLCVKNAVFWDITPCGSCKYRLFPRSVFRLLVTATVVPSSPILITLMKEELSSSETSALTSATQRNIPEDTILHSPLRENLKSYIALTGWTL
jgi:hypothetical protein